MSRYIDADALWMDVIHAMDYADDFLKMIEDAPTEDVRENVHGEWILTDFPDEQTYRCSACDAIWTFIDGTPFDNGAFFCPNCGADMREVKE